MCLRGLSFVPLNALPAGALPAAVLLAVTLITTTAGPARGADVRKLEVSQLGFTVHEQRIILGETEQVTIDITARTADGTPLDVAPPRLVVSTGAISIPKRSAAGSWSAVYTPPAERYPHVAILLAVIDTADTSSVGFVPLRLWGKGQSVVRTKPRSKVTVFIGNESFGPVDADKNGEAPVPITVPPGPERAVAKSIDELGNESQKTIDLRVPSFNRIAMIALDDVAAADGNGAARLLAFVVDKKGEPLFDAQLEAHASVGAVDAPEGLSPGMFRLVYRPGRAAKGKAHVDVTLADSDRSKAGADVELLSGRAAVAKMDTPVTALSADEPREVSVDVHLLDSAGNPVPGQAASLDVDTGRIDRVENIDNGGRRVFWVIPSLVKSPRAVLSARAPSGEVIGKKEIQLRPGKPARITFDPIQEVVADGSESTAVTLHVSDASGNALPPTGATLTTDARFGQIVGATVEGTALRARFVPEAFDHNQLATLTGQVGAITATTTVSLVARPVARLLVGVGVAANVVNNNAGLLGVGPDVSFLVRLPGVASPLYAGLDVAVLQSLLEPSVQRRDFPVFLEGGWRPMLTPWLGLHLGAGAGLVLSDLTTVDNSGEPTARRVEPSLAGQAVAGIGARLGPGMLEADLRAGYSLNLAQFTADQNGGPPVGLGLVLAYRFGM